MPFLVKTTRLTKVLSLASNSKSHCFITYSSVQKLASKSENRAVSSRRSQCIKTTHQRWVFFIYKFNEAEVEPKKVQIASSLLTLHS